MQRDMFSSTTMPASSWVSTIIRNREPWVSRTGPAGLHKYERIDARARSALTVVLILTGFKHVEVTNLGNPIGGPPGERPTPKP